MLLFFHNIFFNDPIANLILFLVVIGGWLFSVFLIFRGIFRFVKSEQKLKLLTLAFTLFVIWRLILFILPIPSDIFSSTALYTFPFGFFGGLPFLFVFDTRDVFVYEILVILGSILNIAAIINFASYFAKKFDNVFE